LRLSRDLKTLQRSQSASQSNAAIEPPAGILPEC
jgi:hypothetical protein